MRGGGRDRGQCRNSSKCGLEQKGSPDTACPHSKGGDLGTEKEVPSPAVSGRGGKRTQVSWP